MTTGADKDFQIWATARKDVFTHDGEKVSPPVGWVFVASGDPGLTRRLKSSGECWVLVRRRKNRTESLGLWTDAARIRQIESQLAAERADPAYLRKLDSARKAREAKQAAYEVEFREAVAKFLAFAPRYRELEGRLADAVTVLAVQVGSGTVARTGRMPVEDRAEAAVIAWLRHQTTAYDKMSIARIKGRRREVRRGLAEGSRRLLEKYRAGDDVDPASCPLKLALGK